MWIGHEADFRIIELVGDGLEVVCFILGEFGVPPRIDCHLGVRFRARGLWKVGRGMIGVVRGLAATRSYDRVHG